jgi:hypothetical protein
VWGGNPPTPSFQVERWKEGVRVTLSGASLEHGVLLPTSHNQNRTREKRSIVIGVLTSSSSLDSLVTSEHGTTRRHRVSSFTSLRSPLSPSPCLLPLHLKRRGGGPTPARDTPPLPRLLLTRDRLSRPSLSHPSLSLLSSPLTRSPPPCTAPVPPHSRQFPLVSSLSPPTPSCPLDALYPSSCHPLVRSVPHPEAPFSTEPRSRPPNRRSCTNIYICLTYS